MARNYAALCLALFFLAACEKEDTDPCLYSPAPRIELTSWPGGLHQDSVWIVSYDDLLLTINVAADGGSEPSDEVKLTSVNVAILATDPAPDSTMYATSQNPNSTSATINTTATLGAVTSDVPAELRISAGNTCSASGSLVRRLRITP